MALTSKRLCELTGLTYRQLDYWVTHGVFPTINESSPGHGVHRRFHEEVVPGLIVLAKVSYAFYGSLPTNILKQIYDNYDVGYIHLNEGVSINWGMFLASIPELAPRKESVR